MLTLLMGVALSACGSTDEGDYKPGLYLGYTDGHQNTYAYVYVDAEGYIADVFIDSIYMKSDEEGPVTWEGRGGDEATGYATSKMSLNYGEDYIMGDNEYTWVEQVSMLGDDVVENQEIIDYDLDDRYFAEDGDDIIAGVSISVDSYLEAVGNALARAELGDDESPSDFDVPNVDEGLSLTPGIHFGYTDGNQNTLGFIAVNDDGNIVYATADEVYLKSDDDGPLNWEARGNENTGYATTKMSLNYGEGYTMSDNEYTWVEQVEMVMDDIIENQSADYNLEGDDDVVSGVSITVSGYIETIQNAIEQAK